MSCPTEAVQVATFGHESLAPDCVVVECNTELCKSIIDPKMRDITIRAPFPVNSITIGQLLDSSNADLRIWGHNLAGGVLHWETFLCLFFAQGGGYFNLNSSSDAKYWGGQFNKYISFDGCNRIRSDDISCNFPPFDSTACDSSCTYNPFSLVDTIIGEFKIGSCISALCWHPCNKLLVEKQLENICSLWDVYKKCYPVCARTWKEVLRSILLKQDMVPSDDIGEDCWNRCLPFAFQLLDVGTIFSNLVDLSGCPDIFVNFNYKVYFGESTAMSVNCLVAPPILVPHRWRPEELDDLNPWCAAGIQADPSIFNCVCGNCLTLCCPPPVALKK